MFENIKGAIFDADGTLLDSLPVWEIVPALYLKTVGVNAKPELPKQVFAMTFEEGSAFIKKEYGLTQSEDEIKKGILETANEQYKSSIPLKNGIKELLEDLHAKGIPMCVASSSQRFQLEPAFKRLGIFDYFEEIFCSSEIGVSKTEPDIYLKASERMGTLPEETCVFEDALFAILTAQKAGFKTCGVFDELSAGDWYSICQKTDWQIK